MSGHEIDKVSVLTGTCPDEVCQSVVVFKPLDQLVFCQRCGQTHEKKRILNVLNLEENSIGMKNTLRSLILAANPNLKKDTDTVKVNGLSNYHCKLLSPFFTEYGMDKLTLKAKPLSELTSNICEDLDDDPHIIIPYDMIECPHIMESGTTLVSMTSKFWCWVHRRGNTCYKATFDCGLLSERCFTICREHLTVPGFGRDTSGSDLYLLETLKKIEEANDNKEVLVPLHADGDGHCLVHAISRALTGRNLFWHPLRSHLKRHLTERRETYEMLLADFINASEWDGIINECDPRYEPDVLKGEVLGLRNIHIFGLANVLKRPIILFDSLAGMKSCGDYSAVFLPSLSKPEECKTKTGEPNSPVCIAWSNAGRGHFIPLVGLRKENPAAIPISMLPEVWAVSGSLITSYMKFTPDGSVLITGKLLQEGYIHKLVNCMDELFLQKHGVHPKLVCDKYQFSSSRLATSDLTPDVVTNQTRRAAQEHRLYRCIDCLALNVSPILAEWLRPGNNGVIYNIAINKYGFLSEGCKYFFAEYGLVCHYDGKKDVLILDSMTSQKCSCCLSSRVRQVHIDGIVAYENGDVTPQRSFSKHCSCGYKHFYGGKEYDNPPDMITVYMNWKGQSLFENIAWFQFESDVALNSNVFQIANMVVQKHFPDEFGTEALVRQVVDQLLSASKRIDERHGQSEASQMSTTHILSKEEKVTSTLQGNTEASAKYDSPTVTAVIKLPEDEVIKNYADSSEVSNLQELTNETKTLVLQQEDKFMYVESEKDDTVSTSEDARDFSFEEDLRQAQLNLQAQQEEYRLKKLHEYRVKSSREKILELLSEPDYEALVCYGPNALNRHTAWDVVNTSSSDGVQNPFQEDDEQPTTTVRVGPGYSVLAPRRGVARTTGSISSRGSRGPSRYANSSQVEDIKDSDNIWAVDRARIRGNTSARATSRPRRRD